MILTPQQLSALKADILADGALASIPLGSDGDQTIADAYNLTVAPDFWVWRTDVTRAQIYHSTSPDATTWNWTTYKQQSVTEQGAWVQMFMGDIADFSLPNLRAGVAAIFTGSVPQNAQRDHILSMGRRKARRIEKLFAVASVGGSGNPGIATNPATMVVQGLLDGPTVGQARSSS